MDQNSALVQDLISTMDFCKKEMKNLAITTRPDVIEAIKQSPEYLQWACIHGLKHAMMLISNTTMKAFTLLAQDLDELENFRI